MAFGSALYVSMTSACEHDTQQFLWKIKRYISWFYSDGMTYYYGTELKYVGVLINTTINGQNLAYITGLPLRNKWEDVMSREVGWIYSIMPIMQGAGIAYKRRTTALYLCMCT